MSLPVHVVLIPFRYSVGFLTGKFTAQAAESNLVLFAAGVYKAFASPKLDPTSLVLQASETFLAQKVLTVLAVAAAWGYCIKIVFHSSLCFILHGSF